jgi:phage terminase small subunit
MASVMPPRDLDAAGRRVWRVALAELQSVGMWTDATGELLGLYCRSLMTARLARTRIQARLEQRGEAIAYYALGSMKQLAIHPDVMIARQAESDAAGYADRLLLSPAARRRAAVGGLGEDADPLDRDITRALRAIEGGKR